MSCYRRSTRFLTLLAAAACAVHACRRVQAAELVPAPAKLETALVVSEQAPVKVGDTIVATVRKGRMFGVMRREGDLLEIQACIGTKIRRGWIDTRHVELLADDDIDLGAEALKIAKALNSKLDMAAYKARLDGLAKRLAAAAARGETVRERLRLIGVQMFKREDFAYAKGIRRLDLVLDKKNGNCRASRCSTSARRGS